VTQDRRSRSARALERLAGALQRAPAPWPQGLGFLLGFWLALELLLPLAARGS